MKKAFSQRKIEKAIWEINQYYDKFPKGYHIDKSYFVHKKIVSTDEVDSFISRLVNLELIEYSSDKKDELPMVKRLPSCVTYFEKKNNVARQAAFAKVTSIISLIISLIALAMTIVKFFIDVSSIVTS